MQPNAGAQVDYCFLLVNYNMSVLVERCIAMLTELVPDGAKYEILIADNSADDRFAIKEDRYSLLINLKLFRLPGFTFSQCLNYLLKRTSCKWVGMIHPDIEFKPDCLAFLTTFLTEHPKAGAVSPNLYYPTGEPNRIRLRFPTVTTETHRLINTITYILSHKHLFPGEVFWDRSEPVVETQMLMSVAMLIRKQMLDEVGPFDESMQVYYLNDYLCARGRQLGWKYYYLREPVTIHFERYTPISDFSGSDEMKYKTDPVPANPRMRHDFVQFLRLCYPVHQAMAIRGMALVHDLIGLVSQLRHYKTRRANVKSMWQSIRVLCGLRP